jgi:drug/metabolite transporter (DMT)-like permease
VKILNERLTVGAGSLALLLAILWGGNSVSIKIALAGIPPLALAGGRFFLGALVVLIWAGLSRIPLRLGNGEKRGLLQLALLFVVQIYLLNAGTHFTLAGRSTILISTFPFSIALFAHLFLPGDRLTPPKVFGMALAFAGVVLIFAESLVLGELAHLPGDLMVMASSLLLGARQVYIKRLAQGIHPAKLLFYQATLSIPVFFLLSAIFESSIPYGLAPDVVGAILYQGLVVAGFCFILLTLLLRRYVASHIGVFGFATPVFGVLLSNLLLGESVSSGLIGGMLLVGAGIAVVNLAP